MNTFNYQAPSLPLILIIAVIITVTVTVIAVFAAKIIKAEFKNRKAKSSKDKDEK